MLDHLRYLQGEPILFYYWSPTGDHGEIQADPAEGRPITSLLGKN